MSFVTRPGGYDLSNQPPYSIEDCHMRVYVLRADHDALERSIDRYLTSVATPQGTRFRPVGNRVIACFTAAKKVTARDPDMGYMHEVDCGFFIPVLKFASDRTLAGWGVFAPYLFVNNGWASITGREVHGFRKEVATSFSRNHDVNADDWTHDAAELDRIEAWAIDTRSRESKLKPHVLCEVDSNPGESEPVEGIHLISSLFGDHPFASLAESVAAMMAKLMWAGDTAHVPIYFLRQLRDPADGVDASPQGIVEGRIGIKVDSVSGMHLAGRHTIKLANLASHPFEQDLGLVPDMLHESALTIDVTLDYGLE